LIEKKNPLKQGLKLLIWRCGWACLEIEKKNPLKQGLKPCVRCGLLQYFVIEKKNPLKQGLKLYNPAAFGILFCLKRRIH